MGFSGGGGGALPAHQHTSIPNEGGPLDLNGVTIGSLTAGSIVYSDGAALQELIKPAVPANEKLTYAPAATAPSWVAAGAAITTNVIHDALTSYFGTTSTTWVSITGFQLTISNQAGGLATIQGNVGIYGVAGREGYFGLMDDGVISTMAQQEVQIVSGNHLFCGATIAMATDGSVIDGAAQAQTGGNTEFNAGNPKGSHLICSEVY